MRKYQINQFQETSYKRSGLFKTFNVIKWKEGEELLHIEGDKKNIITKGNE